MKNGGLIALFLFLSLRVLGQTPPQTRVIVEFQPCFESVPLVLEQGYDLNESAVSFTTFRFYLSKLELLHKGEVVYEEAHSFHLLDVSDKNSLKIVLAVSEKVKFDQFQFQLGIDSTTNVAGAMGGDLDPTKGMYWTWNSGYINFKLEGVSSLSNERNNAFMYHLGGYLSPYETVQKVRLNCSKKSDIKVFVDVAKFMDAVDLKEEPSVMSPGTKSKDLSIHAKSIFRTDDQK